MAPFRALTFRKVATHVGIGMASASFWRGAWYILDDSLFPQSPLASATASLSLGTCGMALSQGLIARAETLSRAGSVRRLCVVRFGALYGVALSCVLVWRGTWILWDVAYERLHVGVSATDEGHLTKSGLVSHGVAAIGLLGCGMFASVLAPPAAASVIRDFSVKTMMQRGGANNGSAAASAAYQGPAQGVAQAFFREGFFQTNPRMQRTLHTNNGSGGRVGRLASKTGGVRSSRNGTATATRVQQRTFHSQQPQPQQQQRYYKCYNTTV